MLRVDRTTAAAEMQIPQQRRGAFGARFVLTLRASVHSSGRPSGDEQAEEWEEWPGEAQERRRAQAGAQGRDDQAPHHLEMRRRAPVLP